MSITYMYAYTYIYAYTYMYAHYIHGSVYKPLQCTHTYMYILWCHNVYLVVIPIPSIA